MSKRDRIQLEFYTDSESEIDQDYRYEDESDNVGLTRNHNSRHKKVRKPKPSDEVSDHSEDTTIKKTRNDSEEKEDDYLLVDIKEAEELHGGSRKSNEGDISLAKRLPKGLKIMEKLGYKVGDVLGPDKNDAAASLSPLTVEFKADKLGVRVRPEKPNIDDKSELLETSKFRERLHDEKEFERKERIFKRMQKLAFNMTGDIDRFKKECDPRDFNVLWRSYVMELLDQMKENPKDQEESVDKSLTPEGVSEEDFELEMFEGLGIDQKIFNLNTFLRTELRYCFYCGSQYKDDEDLYSHCPGFTEEEHE